MQYRLFIKVIMAMMMVVTAPIVSASNLPIELRDFNRTNDLRVKNDGNCPIYKLMIRTVPPEQDGVLNFLARAGAEIAGLGAFTKAIERLEVGESIIVSRSSLLNNEGRKLNNDYMVGSWYFEGSYCGESKSVSFKGD